eukprot:2734691-Alexandrium_andersonii.AAC.1
MSASLVGSEMCIRDRSSSEATVSGVPGASSVSSTRPGTVSASLRRCAPDSQFVIMFLIPSVALLVASVACPRAPGPGFGSTSPSAVRSWTQPPKPAGPLLRA